MTNTLETKLAIESWDEEPYRERSDGSKFARVSTKLSGHDDVVTGSAAFESLMYYADAETCTFVTVMEIDGTVDGRAGTLVLQGSGSYEGTVATMRLTIVRATGELAGATGTAESTSTHADYPNMPLSIRLNR